MEIKPKILNKELAVVISAVVLVAITVLHTWSKNSSDENPPAMTLPNRYILEVSLFNWIARVCVGAVEIGKESSQKTGLSDQQREVLRNGSAVKQYLVRDFSKDDLEQVSLGKLVLMGHLGMNDKFREFSEFYASTFRENDLFKLIVHTYSDSSKDRISFSTEAYQEKRTVIENELGWIGSVLFHDVIKTTDLEGASRLNNKIIRQAKNSAILFAFYIIIVGFGLFAGFLFLLALLGTVLFSRLQFRFCSSQIPSTILLTVFVLYLVLMNLVFLVAEKYFDTPLNRLGFSAFGTLLLALLLFWPLTTGTKFRQVINTVGLHIKGPTDILYNIIIGPLFIAASWPVFAGLLAGYQLILEYFKVDTSAAQHPVVPVLMSTHSTTLVLILILFAVVVAPIVEEIMFRGVFYSWLRLRMGFLLSTLVNSFIFAVVHPQGIIGIVPLALIGCGLCFLREWRGNIYVTMTAHATVNGVVMFTVLQLR